MTKQNAHKLLQERVVDYTQAGFQLESLEDECAVLVYEAGNHSWILMDFLWILFSLVNRIGFSKPDHTVTLRIDEHGAIQEEGFTMDRVSLASPESVRLIMLLVFGLPILFLLVLFLFTAF